MIKVIASDLDGCLWDSRTLHYDALNTALASIDSKYRITLEEHLSKYDGKTTTTKLNMLTESKGLPKELHNEVWKRKQEATIELIREYKPDEYLIGIFKELKRQGFIVHVASNSIRDTVKLYLIKTGLIEFVDFYISNQDVKSPKPHPEMYLKCMIQAGCKPKECLIIEDSHTGRKAAIDSGAHLCAIENPSSFTLERIMDRITECNMENKHKEASPRWQGTKDMNVLIPMAGAGSRFASLGYSFPKPLIPIKNFNDKTMIQVVVENLGIEAHYIYVVQKEHYEKYHLSVVLNLITPNCTIVQIDGVTDGAACTTLLAKQFINNDKHLLIANSDQFLEWNSNEFIYSMIADSIDGGISTFENNHPKWSYAKVDENGYVTEVAEKIPISNLATTGIYYWNKGSEYVKYAEQMIAKDVRHGKEFNGKGEFYVAPVYNEAIADGKKFKVHGCKKLWGIGTPEDLEYFVQNYKL